MNNQSFLSLWYVQALVVLILVGVVTSLFAYTKLTYRESKYGEYGMASINVRGEGEVMAKPDIGTFSFSVMAEGVDAASAQTESATKINDILGYLEESGVEDKDIKTSSYYLNPKYRYETQVCAANSYCPPGNPVIDGYEVSQTITVKVRDLDESGNLISGVGDRGATNISGLSFTIDDEEVLKAEARATAIADAKEKAEKLAEDLGVSIVRIMGYYEDEYYAPYGAGYGGDMMMERSVAKSVSPEMPTGENMITSTVNVTFEIR